MPELVFLAPPTGAGPASDLASALCAEVGRQDAAAFCSAAPPEPLPDRVFVAIGDEAGGLSESQMARTIAVLLRPPGGAGFEVELEWARRAGAAFHVNFAATERLLELGLPARHLQLGVPDGWSAPEPTPGPELTVLRDRGGYFDWLGSLAAIGAGEVVLHERCLGLAPFVAGRHLFVGAPPMLDELASALRAEPERLRRVRQEVAEFLRTALPLALPAAALIGAARGLVAQPLAPLGASSTPGQQLPSSK